MAVAETAEVTGQQVVGVPLAIEALHMRKVYGRKVAVEDVSLQVSQGEIFGFLGPNGAGKSTLVKMLLGLIYPTSGTARLLGQPLGNLEARAKIGFLPELFRFHTWMRADEFLDFHGKLYGMSNAARKRRIPEVLELVGLTARAQDKLQTFSKGMQQRIGLAQALLNSPKLVILDEPTSALDPIGRRDVRDIIRQLKAENVTVFLNSHLLSEIETVCDRVAIIDKGRVVRQGSLAEMLVDTLELEITAGNITPALLDALRQIDPQLHQEGERIRMVTGDHEQVAQIADLLVQMGARLYELHSVRRSLEDLFVRVVESGGDK